MKTINNYFILFLIIVVEGYIVLSSELLAIRQTIPHVGNGTDTVSIIIAAVLLPLAVGYHFGGRFKQKKVFGFYISIRRKLILNIIISSLFLVIGLSHPTLRMFFIGLSDYGINNHLIQIGLYTGIFLIIPIYLLGQTVPLISNYFPKNKIASTTGRILFFSTIGSFLGAVFSTLVLMSIVGVHHTVSLNFILATILVFILSKRVINITTCTSLLICLCALALNSNTMMRWYKIKSNNAYNTVITVAHRDNNIMYINNSNASRFNPRTGRKHIYIEFAEQMAIAPILNASPPRDVLVMGAGAFTFGHGDNNNNYTYIDIDKSLKDVAEQHILEEKLGKNKTFIAQPARGFLNTTDKKYDVIYVDTYRGGAILPEHLVTQEFFTQVKSRVKHHGVVIFNVIVSGNFADQFSRNIDNTLRSVFPHISRHAIKNTYMLWETRKNMMTNIAYIYKHEDNYNPGHIYTDNKNTVFFDKPKSLPK